MKFNIKYLIVARADLNFKMSRNLWDINIEKNLKTNHYLYSDESNTLSS